MLPLSVTVSPSRWLVSVPVRTVISPRCVSIVPELFSTLPLAFPASSRCIHRLLPARMLPNRFTSASDSSSTLPPPYSRLPFSIRPAARSSRSPAVPIKPRFTRSLPETRLSGPPACIVPVSSCTSDAAVSRLSPPPATMRPCCVSLPVLVTVTPLPCNVPACTRSPATFSVSCPPAASVRVNISGLPMSARRSPSATSCPSCASEPVLSCSPPALYSRPVAVLLRAAACNASCVSPSSVPRFSSTPSVITVSRSACTRPVFVHCGRCSVSDCPACSVPLFSSCPTDSDTAGPCSQPVLASCEPDSDSVPPLTSSPGLLTAPRLNTPSSRCPSSRPAFHTVPASSVTAPPRITAPDRFSSAPSSVVVSWPVPVSPP